MGEVLLKINDVSQVKNQNGVDMFAVSTDNTPAAGPRGASDGSLSDGSLSDGSLPDGSLPNGSLSDGSLPNGTNRTLVVQHPDYAWRCHDDSTKGYGFST